MSHQQAAPILIACPACKADVSNQAASCPRCGQPLKEANPDKWKEVRGQLLTTIVTVVALVVTQGVFLYNIHEEANLKQYEVTFRIKQEAYASFMRSVVEAFDAAERSEGKETSQGLNSAKTSYYSLEPFVRDDPRRQLVVTHIEEYGQLCKEVLGKGTASDDDVRRFSEQRDRFRTELYPVLFDQ